MRAFFLAFVLLGIASTAGLRLLPWWGVAALFAGLVLAALASIKWVLPRVLPRILMAPFKAKGAVLRGATVKVHSIVHAPAPPADVLPEDDDPVSSAPGDYYEVDMTVSPRAANGAFALWEPDELRLAGPDETADVPDSDETAGRIWAVQIRRDGGFEPAAGMKLDGRQRLRLLISAPDAQRRLRLRYYFELFGDIALPLPASPAPPVVSPAPRGVTPAAVRPSAASAGPAPRSGAGAAGSGERRSPFAKAH
jgi:hypothetical protein